jgi:hypothetical protein
MPPVQTLATDLTAAMLEGMMSQLMQQKAALASRDLQGLEQAQLALTGLHAQLQNLPATAMQQHASTCRAMAQLIVSTHRLLVAEYHRVSTVLALVQPSTYGAQGRYATAPGTSTTSSREQSA